MILEHGNVSVLAHALESIVSSAVGEIAIFCAQRLCVPACSQRETKRGAAKLTKI